MSSATQNHEQYRSLPIVQFPVKPPRSAVLRVRPHRVPTTDPDLLIATAKRHRVDVDKLRQAVEREFTAKRAKLAAKQKKAANKATPKDPA